MALQDTFNTSYRPEKPRLKDEPFRPDGQALAIRAFWRDVENSVMGEPGKPAEPRPRLAQEPANAQEPADSEPAYDVYGEDKLEVRWRVRQSGLRRLGE